MSYYIYYPYNDHYEDIEVLTCDANEENEDYCDECRYMYNFVHILAWEPSAASVELIKKYVPEVHIIYMSDLDAYGIALKGAGMNMSASIEMAYLINDFKSPVEGDPFYFDEERKMWLERLRKDPAKTFDEMLEKLKGGKDENA